jgi:hypothetical protein
VSVSMLFLCGLSITSMASLAVVAYLHKPLKETSGRTLREREAGRILDRLFGGNGGTCADHFLAGLAARSGRVGGVGDRGAVEMGPDRHGCVGAPVGLDDRAIHSAWDGKGVRRGSCVPQHR